MPRESLDTPENLPKDAPRQVALGQLEDEVPAMPDQAAADLEQPLQACQRPVLDGQGQDQPAQEIAEIVRHPLGGAVHVSEEPLRAAFCAGVTRL